MAFFEDVTISHEMTSNARFRALGAKIRAALEEIGLVRTSDTGQINWETVEFPGVVETDAGYEIYRFNDALQSSRPIFIKIFYGRGAGEKRYRIGVQVGGKTNGSGTLEGGPSTRRNSEPGSASGFAEFGRLHFCLLESTLVMFGCVNPAQSGGTGNNAATWFYEIGRLRDVDGTIRSSESFADAYVSASPGPTSAVGQVEQRNGAVWTASINTPNSTGEAALVNNTASPSAILPYSLATGRVVGPLIGHMPFTAPAVGDKGKVELYGKAREYIRAFSAQMNVILLRE